MANWVGLASQSGCEDGMWTTAIASWVLSTQRNPSEKLPVESLRSGWNDETEGFGVALKPWKRLSVVASAILHVSRIEIVSKRS